MDKVKEEREQSTSKTKRKLTKMNTSLSVKEAEELALMLLKSQ